MAGLARYALRPLSVNMADVRAGLNAHGRREAHDAVAEPGARGASSGRIPAGMWSSAATRPDQRGEAASSFGAPWGRARPAQAGSVRRSRPRALSPALVQCAPGAEDVTPPPARASAPPRAAPGSGGSSPPSPPARCRRRSVRARSRATSARPSDARAARITRFTSGMEGPFIESSVDAEPDEHERVHRVARHLAAHRDRDPRLAARASQMMSSIRSTARWSGL